MLAAVPASAEKTPAPPAQKPPPVKSDQNAFNAGLYTLMELSGVSADELKRYLRGKGYMTEQQAIDNLPEKFVAKMIETENWNKVTAAVKEARTK